MAVSDDHNCLFNNSAGLGLVTQQSVNYNISYKSYDRNVPSFNGSNYYYLNNSVDYVRPNLGLAFSTVKEGDNKNIFEIRDSGDDSEEVKDLSSVTILNVGFGSKVIENVYCGITGKYFIAKNDFFEDRVTGKNFDMGTLIKINDRMNTGVIIENIVADKKKYTVFKYDTGFLAASEIPRRFNIGISYKPVNNLMLAMDIDNLFEDMISSYGGGEQYKLKRSYHFGGEYNFNEYIDFRGGVKKGSQLNGSASSGNYKNILTYTAGVGIRLNSFSADVFLGYADLSKGEKFTISSPWQFGFTGGVLF